MRKRGQERGRKTRHNLRIKSAALSEIFILVIATVAFASLVSFNSESVEAADFTSASCKDTCTNQGGTDADCLTSSNLCHNSQGVLGQVLGNCNVGFCCCWKPVPSCGNICNTGNYNCYSSSNQLPTTADMSTVQTFPNTDCGTETCYCWATATAPPLSCEESCANQGYSYSGCQGSCAQSYTADPDSSKTQCKPYGQTCCCSNEAPPINLNEECNIACSGRQLGTGRWMQACGDSNEDVTSRANLNNVGLSCCCSEKEAAPSGALLNDASCSSECGSSGGSCVPNECEWYNSMGTYYSYYEYGLAACEKNNHCCCVGGTNLPPDSSAPAQSPSAAPAPSKAPADNGMMGMLAASGMGGGIQAYTSGLTKEELAKLKKEAADALNKKTPTKDKSFLSQMLGGTMFTKGKTINAGGALVSGVVWAGLVYGGARLLGQMIGLEDKQTQALSNALAAGAFTWKTLSLLHQATTGLFTKGGSLGWFGQHALGVGIGVGVVMILLTYKNVKHKTVIFTCLPWEAPTKGEKCEECNKDPFRPCSEYRCRALGQACELLNKDKPGQELCTWVNPNDAASPTITPSPGALLPTGLVYKEDTSIRPPALGVRIERDNVTSACLQAFTPLEFGITTNEPAQCKIDYNHTATFDEMQFYFGETNGYAYNHTQRMKIPGIDAMNTTAITAAGGTPILKNDGTMQLFVRCRDANNNFNTDEYSIKFCVDKSPDTTPPLIEGTSITSGSPVQYNADKVPIAVYVNEPAECKWSFEDDKAFENMENNMSCATDASEINARLSYTCSGNLTGVKNNEDNKFYFRCKDKPDKPESERNVMTQGYELLLKGSQPLDIISVYPNETITGSTEAVSVDLQLETSAGSNEGQAFCYFSGTGGNDSYIEMFETNSFQHKQTLQLVAGTYTYYFRCTDLGGNSAEKNTTFSVFSDRTAPKVSRIYKEEGVGLKVVTNEDAECVYSLTSCNFVFNDGLKMPYSNPNIKTNSYAEWKANVVYYIKCRDFYGNEPNQNDCSIIASPVDLTANKS